MQMFLQIPDKAQQSEVRQILIENGITILYELKSLPAFAIEIDKKKMTELKSRYPQWLFIEPQPMQLH